MWIGRSGDFVREAANLFLPTRCAGCGAWDEVVCAECAKQVEAPCHWGSLEMPELFAISDIPLLDGGAYEGRRRGLIVSAKHSPSFDPEELLRQSGMTLGRELGCMLKIGVPSALAQSVGSAQGEALAQDAGSAQDASSAQDAGFARGLGSAQGEAFAQHPGSVRDASSARDTRCFHRKGCTQEERDARLGRHAFTDNAERKEGLALAKGAEIWIIPAPASWKRRLFGRQVTPALACGLAQGLSRETGVQARVVEAVGLRIGTPSQFGVGGAQRRKAKIGSMRARLPLPEPGRIVLVDDVLTTGATMRELARVCAGALACAVFARVNPPSL